MRAGRGPGGSLFAGLALAVLASFGLLGTQCGQTDATWPTVSLTLNAVADDLNALLIVPPGNFAAQVAYVPGTAPLDPTSFQAGLVFWTTQEPIDVSAFFTVGPNGAVALLPGSIGIEPGTWTLVASIADTEGHRTWASYDFAVRAFAAAPPIGSGQQIWFDFTSDRDGIPGPDFALDLETFGLGSSAAPALSDVVRQEVIDRTLARVSDAYHMQDPNGFGAPDPVDVTFSSSDPGSGDVTRICVGGPDPDGNGALGNVTYDPENAMRSGVECGSSPATGVFSREFDNYQNSLAWKSAFDPFTTSAGGTPIGEDSLDPTVLDPGFDPGTATPEELQRWNEIDYALQVFSNALGSIAAHEVGHALGLVPPGPPGGGLYGGSAGAALVHDVASDGSIPTPNYLMRQGSAFSFAQLAGMAGNPLPFFRPLDFAYLRDRTLTVPGLNELLYPPTLTAIDPSVIDASLQVDITGTGFVSPAQVRCVSSAYTYNLLGEVVVSDTEITAWANASQLAPGVYDLEVENPDGQVAVLPNAVSVP